MFVYILISVEVISDVELNEAAPKHVVVELVYAKKTLN
mgnify:CR=1 FL=1